MNGSTQNSVVFLDSSSKIIVCCNKLSFLSFGEDLRFLLRQAINGNHIADPDQAVCQTVTIFSHILLCCSNYAAIILFILCVSYNMMGMSIIQL